MNQMTSDQKKRRIVITGAAGRIGVLLTTHFEASPDYDLVLIDRKSDAGRKIHGADLSEYPGQWAGLMAGADAVIHLAGDPSPAASWASVSKNNIDATLNLFRGAAENNVRRVIYASSLQTMEGYRFTAGPVPLDAPPRPTSFYAVSKLVGEATARHFSETHGLSAICLRIGHARKGAISSGKGLTIWQRAKCLSAEDLCLAFEKAIHAEVPTCAIVPLVSNSDYCRWDMAATERILGFRSAANLRFGKPSMIAKIRENFVYLHRRIFHQAWRHYW